MTESLLSYHTFLPDEAATVAFSHQCAPWVQEGGKLYLHGDLGTGKTTFIRGLLRSCGVQSRIKSPTYTLVEPYNLSKNIFYHFDFYRFSDQKELIDAGFNDILAEAFAFIAIEWPEQASDWLPTPDVRLYLTDHENGRTLSLTAHTSKGKSWVQTFIENRPMP